MRRVVLHDVHVAHGGVLAERYGWGLPIHYGDPAGEYTAARTTTGLLDWSAWGRLILAGRDRAAFLHRLSTNVVEGLLPGQGVATVLTSPTARVIERLIVYAKPEHLLAVTAPQNPARVAKYLRGYIFWQDEVSVQDATAETGMLTLVGPRAAEVVRRATGLAVTGLARHHHLSGVIGGGEALMARGDPIAGDAYHVIIPAELLASAWDALVQAGARPVGLEAWEVLRVEAGMPAYGRELSERVTPLDVGLLSDISFNKGCYTGQEVIARMYNYEKMPRGLYGLRLAQPLPLDATPTVEADGKPIGEVTSAVVSPSLGPIALAILRRAQASVGAEVNVLINGQAVAAQVVSLPFDAS